MNEPAEKKQLDWRFTVPVALVVGLLFLFDLIGGVRSVQMPDPGPLLTHLKSRFQPGDRLLIFPEVSPGQAARFGTLPLFDPTPQRRDTNPTLNRVWLASYGGIAPRPAGWREYVASDSVSLGDWRLTRWDRKPAVARQFQFRNHIEHAVVTVRGQKSIRARWNGRHWSARLPGQTSIVERLSAKIGGRFEPVLEVGLFKKYPVSVQLKGVPTGKLLRLKLGFADHHLKRARRVRATVEVLLNGKQLKLLRTSGRRGLQQHKIPLPKSAGGGLFELRFKLESPGHAPPLSIRAEVVQ